MTSPAIPQPGAGLAAERRTGVVNSVSTDRSTVSVYVGGDTTTPVDLNYLSSYAPVAGDTVAIIASGPDQFVIGATSAVSLPGLWIPTGIVGADQITGAPTGANVTTITGQNANVDWPWVVLQISYTLGAAISNNASGNIANTPIAILPAAWTPVVSQIIGSGATGPVATHSVRDTGVVTLDATTPGMVLSEGTALSVSGVYRIN